jgi:hypothetical protein
MLPLLAQVMMFRVLSLPAPAGQAGDSVLHTASRSRETPLFSMKSDDLIPSGLPR